MTQASFEVTHHHEGFRLSERAVMQMLLTTIIVTQTAWIGLLGYTAWHLLFG
jgi:hypothetical protein